MHHPESIRYLRERVPVRGVLHVGKKPYLLLEKIGRGERKRYWVFEQRAGSDGFRQVLVFPRDQTSQNHLRVLQRLSKGNSNLPAIIRCVPQGDELFVVTDWVRGIDLDSYVEKAQRGERRWPSPFETMRLYRGLAHGLLQMHRHRGIVHRDIKPANLVMSREPNRWVMIDFGSAWMVEKSYRRISGDGISEFFAPPELQIDPPTADFRSDQFSATAVAYWMLTGKVPYGGSGGTAGTPEKRSTHESLYKPPSRLCPVRQEIPKRIWRLVDRIVETGLALDPTSRFQSDSLWVDALEDLHCEMRRRVKFNRFDVWTMRLFEWLAGRRKGRP